MSMALAAEPIAHVGSFPITNAMLNAWIAVAFFIVVAAIARKRVGIVPKGIHNVFEAIVEFLYLEARKVTGDKERAYAFLPLVGTIFLFVLVLNWMGLLPGTGSIGVWQMVHGHQELVPIFRPASSDVNMTLAIAAFAIISTHVFGIVKLGAVEHVSKFFNVRGIARAVKKGPMAIVVSMIEFMVGIIEIASEFAKTASLSLRLFGNVLAGEILLTVMMGILAYVLPVPFIFLELLVGLIQATVFAMLTLAFLTVATEAHGPHDEDGHHEDGVHAAPESATATA